MQKTRFKPNNQLISGAELTDMYTVHWTEYDTVTRQEYLQV